MTGGGMPLPCQREHACGHYKGEKRLEKEMGRALLLASMRENACGGEWPYLSTNIIYLPPLSSPAGSLFRLHSTAAPSEARAASDSCESVKEEYMTRFHSCYITLLGRA